MGWDVLGLDADPTPGDPSAVRDLARRLLEFAADVERARGQVAALTADGAARSWLGRAGDGYRDELGEFPGQLRALETSHRMAGDALNAYGPVLETAQAQADAALASGLDACARRDQAHALAALARTALISASPAVAIPVAVPATAVPGVSASGLFAGPVEAPPPDPAQVTWAIHDRDTAMARLERARRTFQDAQADLDTARRLASSARQMREDAATICAAAIRAASRAGIRNRSRHFWEVVTEHAGRFWNAAVRAAKTTVAVLGVVAPVIGGPVAWVVFAAALVVLADTLARYGAGRASLGDVGLALLGCVPGGGGLVTLGELARDAHGAGQVLTGGRLRSAPATGGTRLTSLAADIRSLRVRTSTLSRNFPGRHPPTGEGAVNADGAPPIADGATAGSAGATG
ncbi:MULTISPECIES: putative T7SS-secreted protein [unclassified Frankia]|uniref:putative T7SS-secreted protein n=1 Tax=unclassified Frankia TaxID=2632575 RepID=UPI0020254884